MATDFTGSARVAGQSDSAVLPNVARRRVVVPDMATVRRYGNPWAAGVYGLGARVMHLGLAWISTAAANSTEPGQPAATWEETA